MDKLQFQPRITYKNDKVLPLSIQHSIKVSPGVTAYAPIFVDAPRMQALLKAKNSSGAGQGLKITEGLTVADLSVSFSDLAKQWTKIESRDAPPRWRFAGGVVYLDLEIAVYLLQGLDSPPKAYAAIMEHEYLHVLDDVTIVKKTLPEALLKDDTYVKPYLVQGREVSDQTFQNVFRGQRFTDWVQGFWAEKSNERQSFRDSEAEYKRFRDRIEAARTEMNIPHRQPSLKHRQNVSPNP